MKEHRICVANRFQMNVHGVVDSSQHLHHELGVQQHAVTRFPPELLLLPGEATHAQPEGKTQNILSHKRKVAALGGKKSKYIFMFCFLNPIKCRNQKKGNQITQLANGVKFGIFWCRPS